MNKKNTKSIFWEDERVDGADKVTGKAKYTAEHNLPNLAYAVFVTSNIAKGTIKNIDTSKAYNIIIIILTPRLFIIIYQTSGSCFNIE